MSPPLAAIIFGVGILGLFLFDRGKATRGSKALWIPTVWLFFCSSRSLAQWLGMDTEADQAVGYIEGSPVDRVLYIVLVVIALIVLIKRGRTVFPILRGNWAIGLFFFYAALSMAWSDYPFVTLKHWIKGIGDFMMVLIVLTEPDVLEAIKRLVTRLGFVLVPLSLLLIWHYPSLGRTHTMDWTPEPIGVTTQKNSLGILCDCIGIALLWRFRNAYNDRKDPNRRLRLLALGAVLAMIVWLLHLCNSMTSICALSMAGGVMLLSTNPVFRRRHAFVHFFIVGVLVLTMFALFFQSSGGLIASLGRDPTLTGRTTFWPELIKLVNHHLVGVGYESFWLGPRLQKVWVITQGLQINEAHSGYVEIFITLGWIGLALMGVLIATGYRNVIAAYRHDPDAGGLRIAWFLAPLITGFTEAGFRVMSLTWIVFLLATANSRWDTARKTGHRGRPTGEPQRLPEEPCSVTRMQYFKRAVCRITHEALTYPWRFLRMDREAKSQADIVAALATPNP
jgi:exopolysaccharide production protein ExoQ